MIPIEKILESRLMPEKLKKENPAQKNTRKKRENLLKASRKTRE